MDANALDQIADKRKQQIERFILVLLGNVRPCGQRNQRLVHEIIRVYVEHMRQLILPSVGTGQAKRVETTAHINTGKTVVHLNKTGLPRMRWMSRVLFSSCRSED